MTDIWNGVRTIIVVIFVLLIVGGVVYGVSQIIPQYESVRTADARINSQNAMLLEEAKAAPTYTFLSVEGTRVAIENGQILAKAQADAQTIHAQGEADYSRGLIDTFKNLILTVGGLFVLAAVGFVGLRTLQAYIFTRPTHTAINEAKQRGGSVELPNGHRVTFQKEKKVSLLGSGNSESKSFKKDNSKVKRF